MLQVEPSNGMGEDLDRIVPNVDGKPSSSSKAPIKHGQIWVVVLHSSHTSHPFVELWCPEQSHVTFLLVPLVPLLLSSVLFWLMAAALEGIIWF